MLPSSSLKFFFPSCSLSSFPSIFLILHHLSSVIFITNFSSFLFLSIHCSIPSLRLFSISHSSPPRLFLYLLSIYCSIPSRLFSASFPSQPRSLPPLAHTHTLTTLPALLCLLIGPYASISFRPCHYSTSRQEGEKEEPELISRRARRAYWLSGGVGRQREI